ncbi:MAG: tetratricopeptide repeat protein [Chloroflexia bacterium]|nr:tetratricopeptide repeat protein [Chloroflexia bacterium]
MTSFIGREAHRAAIVDMIRQPDVRLLTLAGPAGVGKTRLALAAAEALVDEFPDGVHFNSFSSLRSSDQVPAAIAEALNIRSMAGDSIESRIIANCRDRTMLLVLDNLEHVLPVPFITRILTACRQVKVLATSRTVLRLSGEHEYVVPPMEVPVAGDIRLASDLDNVESVSLLLNRARQSSPAFTLTDENAVDIAAICTRLDGLPLAIELAAARMKVFPPAALLDRLSDRLSLLTGGPSDQPLHQRTIRATIDWSHDLLSPREQRMFRRLAVFSSGITMQAAAAICLDDNDDAFTYVEALDELTLLVDKSLVQQEPESGDGPSFFLLETVRHYAMERLCASGEDHTIRERHAVHYLDFAERTTELLRGPEQVIWLDRIEANQPNIRLALETLRQIDDFERYARLCCALFRFWRLRGVLAEGRAWLDVALEPAWQVQLPDDLRSLVFTSSGWLALDQGDADHAESCGDRGLEIATRICHDSGIALAYGLLAFVDHRQGIDTRAVERLDLSLLHYRAAGDDHNVAGTLNNLALIALGSGDLEHAASMFEKSRDAFLALGNLRGVSHGIHNRGVALYCLGQYDEALRCSRESYAIDRKLADKRGSAVSLDHIGKCARALGDLIMAWEAHAQSLPLRKEIGDPRGLLVWLEAMALWMAHAARPELAARTLGAIEVVRIGSNIPIHKNELGDHEATETLARERLGDREFEAHLARGRWLSLDEAVAAMWETAEQCVLELEHGAPTTPAGTTSILGLTPREHEVLMLIAQRYTDKEIADALFISPRTVARHVTGIFTKLDVHSRREAAAKVTGSQPV